MQLDELQFNLNNVYSLRAVDGDETVNIGAFRGNLSISVFRKGTGRPVMKMPLDRHLSYKLMKAVEQLKQAQPGTRIDIGQGQYNRDTKKYEPYATIVLFKDDRQVYGMEIGGAGLTPPLKCLFKAPGSLTMGNEPLSEQERSATALAAFHEFLNKELPILRVICRFNMPKPNFQGGGQGGNRGGSGGGGGSYGGGGGDTAF